MSATWGLPQVGLLPKVAFPRGGRRYEVQLPEVLFTESVPLLIQESRALFKKQLTARSA